jgi:two-component system response regulator BaeR
MSSRLVLDRDNYVAQLDGVIINLTRVEFRLLATLINKSGKVCLRETLINGLYDDYRVVSDRTVDTHVKNLRKKFAAIVPGTELIRSVYGLGYVMDMPN